jgi:ubiquinone biosynthesis protein UbiJ
MELDDEKALLITTRGSEMRLEGDLNYDEKVDIYDLMLLVDFNLGYEGQVNPYFGDINSDGMVNVMDLIALIQMIMGYGE